MSCNPNFNLKGFFMSNINTLAARGNAEGYSLNMVIEACRKQASINGEPGCFPGWTDKFLSCEEMASAIYGYTTYKGGYLFSGETWMADAKVDFTVYANVLWSRINDSHGPSGSMEELVGVLKSLNCGTTLVNETQMTERSSEEFTKRPDGRWQSTWVEDPTYAKKAECHFSDMFKVASLLRVPVTRAFAEIFKEALAKL